MIGVSPLLHPAAVDWTPAARVMPAEVLAELTAWVADHDPPHGLDEIDRLVIGPRDLLIHYTGTRRQLGPLVAPLRSQPSARMLAGLVRAAVLVCAARMAGTDDAERYRCNVAVDAEGRHAGSHVDGRFGDEAEWPNGNPAPTPAGALVLPPAADLAMLPLGLPGPADLAPASQLAQLVELVPAGAPSRHRGVYVLGDETIARALRLPAGQHIMGIGTDFERLAILINAEGEGLPEVAEGMHAPTVGGGWWGITPPSPHTLAALPPPQRHAAVLVAVEGTVLEDDRALQGRLRILTRHRPISSGHRSVAPGFTDECHACDLTDWPCLDYRDAAGGLLELPADPDDPDGDAAELGGDG